MYEGWNRDIQKRMGALIHGYKRKEEDLKDMNDLKYMKDLKDMKERKWQCGKTSR